MTAFSLTASYATDWQLVDFVENTSWIHGSTTTDGLKAQRGPVSTPDLVAVAASIGISSDAVEIAVWQANALTTFDPEEGHILRMASSGDWLIKSSLAIRFGNWVCLCEKVPTNADVTS